MNSTKKRKPFGEKQLTFSATNFNKDDAYSVSASDYADSKCGKLSSSVQKSSDNTELPDITTNTKIKNENLGQSISHTQFNINLQLNNKSSENQSMKANSHLSKEVNDISTISKHESNRRNNGEEEDNERNYNLDQSLHSILTNDDISLLKNNNRLDRCIVDKALLYNKDKYDDVVPFHLKYFMENTEKDLDSEKGDKNDLNEFDFLDKKSSYFKTRDKEQFLKNLTEMTKLDSKLYDKTQIYDKIKGETKKLLMTEITQYYDDNTKQSTGLDKDNLSEVNEGEEDPKEAEVKSDKDLNNRLKGMLELYKDIDKKQRNFEKNNKFKDFITPNQPNGLQNKAVKNYIDINKQELYGKSLNKYAYPKLNTKIEDYDKILESYKPLSHANLDDPEDQLQVDFGYLSKQHLNGLSEIDKKLEQLNQKYEENSINNEIKKIKGNILLENAKIRDEKMFGKEKESKETKGYLQLQREKREKEAKLNEINNGLLVNIYTNLIFFLIESSGF